MENSEGRHPCIPSRVDSARPFPSVPFIRKDNILVELEIIVVFTDEPKTVLQDSGQKVVLSSRLSNFRPNYSPKNTPSG